MNKTININLANTFFHIDEDAYNKLQRYLDAIRRSFTNSQGRDEIISDIEARIAELFAERMQHNRQVISGKEVDDVIAVMGQPEDYLVDEEIFDDQPASKGSRSKSERSGKKLYRDIDNKYIGGVCAGLSHYLRIDVVWIRLLFILFGVFSGFGIIAYILFWILAPEAITTSQKLDMTGEAVNISNIERKVKEGFDEVASKVKNVDYEKVGSKVKSSSKTFFDTLGDVIMFFFKVFAKFIGILFLIIGATALIGLFVGLFTFGAVGINIPGIDIVNLVNTTGVPLWIVSILTFFAVGIPFFFLFILGLKILVNNLKPLSKIAKYSLLAIWLLSIVSLIVLGVRQAAEHAYTGSVSSKEQLAIIPGDTLHIKMSEKDLEGYRYNRNFEMSVFLDEENRENLYMKHVHFNIEHADEDSLAYVKVRKDANGRDIKAAKNRADQIVYNYTLNNNTLLLDDFLTTDVNNKFRDQEVTTTLYLPTGTVVSFDDSTFNYVGRSIDNDRDYYRSGVVDHTWIMGQDGELKCLDCPEEEDEEAEIIINTEDDKGHVRIDSAGVDINLTSDDGKHFEMKINEEGVKIESDKN